MPPTLILIRHGEALHNVAHKCKPWPNKHKKTYPNYTALDYSIPDPELSKLGEQQCSALEQNLRDKLPLAIKVEVIVTSPMRRTLQTTSIGLDWLLKKGVPMELDPLWQGKS